MNTSLKASVHEGPGVKRLSAWRLSAWRLSAWGLGAAVALAVAAGGVAGGLAVQARESAPPAALPSVRLAELPPEAHTTHRLILQGGPFPYRKDGTVFGNRERLLPGRPRGEYREYTVPTPGSPDRGARRIVCGGEPPSAPDVCYYTADHYASFRRIAP